MDLWRADRFELATEFLQLLVQLSMIVLAPGISRDATSRTVVATRTVTLQGVIADPERDQRARVRHVVPRVAGESGPVRGEPREPGKESGRHALQNRPFGRDEWLGRCDPDEVKAG